MKKSLYSGIDNPTRNPFSDTPSPIEGTLLRCTLPMCVFILLSSVTFGQNFITEWTFDSADTEIVFNALTSGSVAYTWNAAPSENGGAGSFIQTTGDEVALTDLNIEAGDVVTLSMESDNLNRFYIGYGPDRQKLTDVVQWGSAAWTSMEGAFEGCTNLTVSAVDTPDLSNVTNMARMFQAASQFNSDISSWDVSNVTNMTRAFDAASLFNQDIGGWDVSNVTSMFKTFNQASDFNQDLSEWNVEAVTNMQEMFRLASDFNKDIGSWILNPDVDMINMLNSNGMDCAHYSATLVGWHANNPFVTDVILTAFNLEYGTSAVDARNALIEDQGWTITNDSQSEEACDELLSVGLFSANPRGQLEVYPNPTSDRIFVNSNSAYPDQITVLSATGQDVTSQTAIQREPNGETTIDVSRLHAGMYILKTSAASAIILKQ